MAYRVSKNQDGVIPGKVRFEFDLRLLGTRYRKMLICQKSVVQSLYRQWERQIVDGTGNDCTFFEILDHYVMHSKEVKTGRTYRHEVSIITNVFKKYFTKEIRIQDIRRKHIEDFIKWRRHVCNHKYNVKEQVTNATINRSLALLSYIFNWSLVREQYHGTNPCFKMKLKENNIREVRLDSRQIQELLEKAEAQDTKLYNVIMTALMTGMRFSEIVELTWSEVDFDRNTIFLSRLKTKSKRARIIPIIPELKSLLLKLQNKRINVRVFDTSFHYIQKHWKRLQPQLSFANLDDGTRFRFHDLRHIVAQFLIDKGTPMEIVQVILGHADISTTQRRYAMHARPDLHEKMSKLGEIIPLRKASYI